MTKKNQKDKKSDKKKLIIMSVITMTVIIGYLYLQFSDFDPTYSTDMAFTDPSVKDMSVKTHLKNGIEEYIVKIGDGVFQEDNPKIVEQIEYDDDSVTGMEVSTDMDNGTKLYKVNISDGVGQKDEDLAKYSELIATGTCEQLTELLDREDFKSDAFRKVTQKEYDKRCP